MADVPGVIVDGKVARTLDADSTESWIERRIATGGMAAKLQAASAAIARGVERVRIGDIQAILDPDAGTTLVPSRSFA